MVYALRTRDGSLLWRAHTSGGHAGVSSRWWSIASCMSWGKRCRVYELRASSGSPLWQAQAGTIGAMVSTLLVIKSLAYVVNSGDGTMDTLGASTSAVRWWYSLGQPNPGVVLPMVVGS